MVMDMMTAPQDTTNFAPTTVRLRREALGLTQIQLANLADCSPDSVGRIEAGYAPRSSRVVPRIEAALASAESQR